MGFFEFLLLALLGLGIVCFGIGYVIMVVVTPFGIIISAINCFIWFCRKPLHDENYEEAYLQAQEDVKQWLLALALEVILAVIAVALVKHLV